MKTYSLFAVVLCFLALKGAEGRFTETRAEDEKCEKLYSTFAKYIGVIKKEMPVIYAQMENSLKVAFNFDINNKDAMKAKMCLFANAKTLQDIHKIIPVVPYGQLLNMYNYTRSMYVSLGGYTNARRILEVSLELRQWIESLKVSDPTEVKNGTSLDDVERFFEVMQVKYGSRWLSLVVMASNQEILIEDPKEFAKNLYECISQEDFQKRTGIKMEHVHTLWRAFTAKDLPALVMFMSTGNHIDIVVDWENVVGDMGFWNLEY